jgi:hypothetical protein
MEEAAYVEYGGAPAARADRLTEMRALAYNDLAADRQVVAAVEAMEAILAHAARGESDGVVHMRADGRRWLHLPGRPEPVVLS